MSASTRPLPIRRVAVLGAGVMGSGIAAHCANAGIPVTVTVAVKREPGFDSELVLAPPGGLPPNTSNNSITNTVSNTNPATNPNPNYPPTTPTASTTPTPSNNAPTPTPAPKTTQTLKGFVGGLVVETVRGQSTTRAPQALLARAGATQSAPPCV